MIPPALGGPGNGRTGGRGRRLRHGPLEAQHGALGGHQIARRAPQHAARHVVPLEDEVVLRQPQPGRLGAVRVQPAAQLGPYGQRGGHRRQRLAGAQQLLLGALLQALQQRGQAVPPGGLTVLGGHRQLLVERGRRPGDGGHLGRGDLRQDLDAGLPGLAEGAVRAREDVAHAHQPLLGVLADVEHGLDLAAYVLQGEGGAVVAAGVGAAPAGRGSGRGAGPEGERIGYHFGPQRGQFRGDPLQVVAGGVVAGAHAHGVGQGAAALQFGGEQVDAGGQRGPDGVGGDHHVQGAGVPAVHPVDQLVQAEPFAELRGGSQQHGRGRRRAGGQGDPGAAQQVRQLRQLALGGPAAAGAQLTGRLQRVGIGVEVHPQLRDERLGDLPPVLGHPGQLRALQQATAGMVLEGQQRGLHGLVLRAESRQRTVHLLAAQGRPGGPRDRHRSPLLCAAHATHERCERDSPSVPVRRRSPVPVGQSSYVGPCTSLLVLRFSCVSPCTSVPEGR
ncbi:hypothetical protein J3S04_19855 [Streptomyces griseocarneus]|uniref:Uncharacterized protein n=1 Tax=Streptomyces griseocarneus TaxID=51201 RepID=A0ABX7RJM0_9ACTN|nr:hypothetical protein J3S04_19855 [Streptomyces griseocarneus]